MSPRSIVLLTIAGIIAFATALMVRNHISTSTAAASTPQDVTRILVARHDIVPGSFIQTGRDLEWAQWPDQQLNPSYAVEGNIELASLDGSVVRRQLLKGEPITDGLLVKADEGGFMAAVLGAGMRAISIAVDATTGNAGFIAPGDKVDLILTHRIEIEGADGESQEDLLASETFIHDVRVLAVDQQLDNPDNSAILAKTVTLEVSTAQAEKINVAKDLGKISLSLRSLVKEESVVQKDRPHATRDSDVSSVMPSRSSTEIRRVVVIRGAEREELQFSN